MALEPIAIYSCICMCSWRTGHGAHGIRTACTCAAAVYACACTAIYAAAAVLLCCACMYTRAVHAYAYIYACMCCCATVHVLLRCCAAAGTCAHMYKGCYKGIIIKYGRTRRDASSIYTCTCTYTCTLTLKVISSPNEKIGQLQLER